MIYLATNTASQILRLTLNEARQYFATTYTNYLLVITHEENSPVGNDLRQVCLVVSETQRITTLNISTVGLTLAGRYRYEVYGQNSAVNTNPADVSVVGLCEEGLLELTDNSSYFSVPNVSILDDIIYNG